MPTIEQVIRSHDHCAVTEDPFLSNIGGLIASHDFLRRSTQAVYIRQVELFTEILTKSMGCRPRRTNVLDWGCGKGHITYLLGKQGFNVISCDVRSAEPDSSFAQETPILRHLAAQVIPLEDPVLLPFEDSTFDAVVSFGVLEHVKSDWLSMREIRRILKKGGLFFVAFLPYRLSWTQAVARVRGETYHDRLYTQERIRQLAANSCFRVVSMRHAQLLPKNSVPIQCDRWLEPIDRLFCTYTPLRYFATNLELVLVADGSGDEGY